MHTSPSGKRYIGITKQKPERRWRAKGQGYKNNSYFAKAIQKYGWDNFEHKILYKYLTQQEAEEKEMELISYYKTSNKKYGYNLDNGGNSVGTLTEETKEKLRQANLGRKANKKALENMRIAQQKVRQYEKEHNIKRKMPKGEENHFFGKHHTEEAKQKIREKNSGKNSAWWGRKHTSEEIQKISNSRKKQVEQLDDNYNVLNVFDSILDASKKLNCKPYGIYASIHRKTKSHGYYWRIKEVKTLCQGQ